MHTIRQGKAATALQMPVPSISFRRILRMFVTAVDTLLLWQERNRQRHRLAELDERMLHDIGITRAQALIEANKPFWKP